MFEYFLVVVYWEPEDSLKAPLTESADQILLNPTRVGRVQTALHSPSHVDEHADSGCQVLIFQSCRPTREKITK